MVLCDIHIPMTDRHGYVVTWKKRFSLPFYPHDGVRLELGCYSAPICRVKYASFNTATDTAFVSLESHDTLLSWSDAFASMAESRWELVSWPVDGATPDLEKLIKKYKEVPDAPQS